MKKWYIVLSIVLVSSVLLFRHNASSSTSRTGIASPQPTPRQSNSSSLGVTSMNQPSPSVQLALPFDITDLPHPPHSFGLYPYGIKSSEHPEGHAGLNIETTDTTSVMAPADMKITSITSPAGRPDEHNVEAEAVTKPYHFEYLRVGSLVAGIQVSSIVKTGQKFAVPGKNHSLGVAMFHFGILDAQDNALCPQESLWLPSTWETLNIMLHNSRDDKQQPYSSLCYTTQPILAKTRHIE